MCFYRLVYNVFWNSLNELDVLCDYDVLDSDGRFVHNAEVDFGKSIGRYGCRGCSAANISNLPCSQCSQFKDIEHLVVNQGCFDNNS